MRMEWGDEVNIEGDVKECSSWRGKKRSKSFRQEKIDAAMGGRARSRNPKS